MTTKSQFQKIKSGDSKAFEALFNQLYPSMCVLAREYVKDDGMAEDIAQEAFVKLWNARDRYEDITSVKSFLYVMVKNLSLNSLKRDKLGSKFTESLDKEDYYYFNNRIVEEETYRILQQAIDELPHRSAAIMNLSLLGVRNHEIAERLGISVNTVKTLKYNSMKTLRVKLKNYFFILLLLLGEI
ncbi:RNA polymerase sigma-70 factor [Labilibaculum sp. A4]|uniref:RNA polymerase sigma-70 factor n=1 Tax=Labilibaculum euxinus TaxID=2686357 RepID=UPI000F61ABB6|nr:RNA polymerase sigma-70 factor [Labilibaculum euxinus]MDQ1770626.1 RNA polymerase sigma-70 factor [Labilibaculum euxinus]MWN75154.1 RNA polymerase sigma-70 factor [Labilibaculum euxinus]